MNDTQMSNTLPEFIPGITLNRRLYWEVVRPLLDRHLPHLPHSASLIGYGSDVFGYDTIMSTDHNWGPRLQLFLGEEDYVTQVAAVDEMLRYNLPPKFAGYSVHYTLPDPNDNGTQRRAEYTGGPINHLLELRTVDDYFKNRLGVTPSKPLTPQDWLALPEQKLLEMTSGQVYYDGLGTLAPARIRFVYYPRAVWLAKLAAQWHRIAEEEAFMGRTGELDDELGSWIIAARLVRDLIRLSFLYARRYAPYSKWLGTAFSQLPIAAELAPLLLEVRHAGDWRTREHSLIAAYSLLAEEHNRQGITPRLDSRTRDYFGRPYQVLFAGRFAKAITAQIPDPTLRGLAARVGGVDQFSDFTAINSDATLAARLKTIYDPIQS